MTCPKINNSVDPSIIEMRNKVLNNVVEGNVYVYDRIDIWESFVKKIAELKEEQRKKDEDLIALMEETKVTKDKRKQQEKQRAKEANLEHQRKKKEREEFYRRNGMLGAKPAKKNKK